MENFEDESWPASFQNPTRTRVEAKPPLSERSVNGSKMRRPPMPIFTRMNILFKPLLRRHYKLKKIWFGERETLAYIFSKVKPTLQWGTLYRSMINNA